MPAHYVWTQRGCIFVGGYWDYPVEHRGLLFAPVYFEAGAFARRGYIYSPAIVLDLGVFSAHLFLRPSYSHYYFGDYYAASYAVGGFYASYSFGSSRHGFDPIYSHQRWEHRDDREWEHRTAAAYDYRRVHENARPPRTWAVQRSITSATPDFLQNRPMVATSMNEMAKRKGNVVRFQQVDRQERQQIVKRGQEVQQSREQRRALEARPMQPASRQPGAMLAARSVQAPRSPIIGKPISQLGRNQAPPRAQQPAPVSSRPQLQAPSAGPQTRPTPGRHLTPDGEQRGKQPERPRARESGANTPEALQRNASRPDPNPTRAAPQQAKAFGVQPGSASAPSETVSDTKARPRPTAAGTPAISSHQRKMGTSIRQPQRAADSGIRNRPVDIEKGATRLWRGDDPQGSKSGTQEALKSQRQ
jgi:hypothetical protein